MRFQAHRGEDRNVRKCATNHAHQSFACTRFAVTALPNWREAAQITHASVGVRPPLSSLVCESAMVQIAQTICLVAQKCRAFARSHSL